MPINNSGNDAEIVKGFSQGVVTVGNSEVEAMVGGSRRDGRQMLRVYNKSSNVIYFGPSGVTTTTGEPIEKKQWVNIPASDGLALYLIAGSAANDVIVSEWS